MIEREFIPYEQAIALKELGFNDPCFGWFTDGHLRIGAVVENKHVQGEGELLAPTFLQAFRWFREKHNLLVSPFQSLDDKTYQVKDYYFEIGKIGNLYVIVSTDNFQTYEEAELACLRKLIELIKNKKL